jgi:CYTH domain-containing protein
MYTWPTGFPQQKLPYNKKTKGWRKSNVDFSDMSSMMYDNNVRMSLRHKKINYDLWNGKIHLSDLKQVINPYGIDSEGFVPESIQYLSIVNSPINVLVGEEAKRRFEFKAVVSNNNAISEKENQRKTELDQAFMQLIQDSSANEDDFQKKLKEHGDYFMYSWQDARERSANFLLSHYIKELDMKIIWNQGMKDVAICGEEMYDFDVVHGEPTFERLNPQKVFVLRNGYSSRAEDADLIIMQDYWSPGRIIDTYYDELKEDDIDLINKTNSISKVDDMDNIDERSSLIYTPAVGDEANSVDQMIYFAGAMGRTFSNYYDGNGNIRVLRVRWKSQRKVLKLKYYNEQTGEEEFTFVPEDYIADKARGEEVTPYWINEAWEGTKIGKDIYVNMRPRKIQYNRISNPSRCHLGVIGQTYNTNHAKPVSVLDRMKPYAYLYTIVADRLNKAMSRSYGQSIEVDFAKIPDGWTFETWFHFLKQDGIAAVDSFKEGNKGASTGKLAASLNNTTGKVLNLDNSASINFHLSLLEWIKNEMFEIAGISRQRQGQITSSETLGGIERSVNASANITEELFYIHDNVKKRCLECLIETAKIALKNNKKKFQNISDDYSMEVYEIGGEDFSEIDFGIIVDNSASVTNLDQKLEQLAHAALQTSTLSFSTIMKIFTSSSLAENIKMIEKDEKARMELNAQIEKSKQDQLQQQLQTQLEIEKFRENMSQQTLQANIEMNKLDNETKIQVAEINANSKPEQQDDSAKIGLEEKKHRDKMVLDAATLEETKRSNEAKETIARNKPKTSK